MQNTGKEGNQGKEFNRHKFGRIAFISTPRFRTERPGDVKSFVCNNMYSLFKNFNVIATGGTRNFLKEFLEPKTIDRLLACDKKEYNSCLTAKLRI